MRALCIGRHVYISEHFARVFRRYGLDTVPLVGVASALACARSVDPDLVLCDFDLLAAADIELFEHHPVLATVPLVAISMTRRADEVHLLGSEGIAGFLYLPLLRPEDARRVLGVARPPRSYSLPSSFGQPMTVQPPPA